MVHTELFSRTMHLLMSLGRTSSYGALEAPQTSFHLSVHLWLVQSTGRENTTREEKKDFSYMYIKQRTEFVNVIDDFSTKITSVSAECE